MELGVWLSEANSPATSRELGHLDNDWHRHYYVKECDYYLTDNSTNFEQTLTSESGSSRFYTRTKYSLVAQFYRST
jgi:hypothetical protein